MKKMTAKEFLKTLNLPKNWSGEDEEYGQWLFYEKNVIEVMEQYHQSKVNNVVLDDVNESEYCFVKFTNWKGRKESRSIKGTEEEVLKLLQKGGFEDITVKRIHFR